MTNPNSEISNYVDLLIVDALLGNNSLDKTAQVESVMSSIVDKIKNYVSNNIDPDDRVGSVLNMLAPGLITTTLSMFGLPRPISFLLGVLARFFHLDVAKMLRSIWEKLKEALGGGKQVSSEQVHNIVQSTVQEHTTPATEEEAEEASKQTETSMVDDSAISVANQLRTAQLLRLAIDSYQQELRHKTAAPRGSSSLFSSFSSRKSATSSLLTRVLSFLFRVILSAAGLMVVGDVMNKFLGRPSALDSKVRGGELVPQQQSFPSQSTSKQTTFKLNPSYQDVARNTSGVSWIENIPNNEGSVTQMLVNFAKDVYQGLDGKENAIEASPHFHQMVTTITWYNHTAVGGPVVFIPKAFTTKKQLVDAFIDDVAQNTPQSTGDMKTYSV